MTDRADIECLFKCSKIDLQITIRSFKLIEKIGFSPEPKNSFLFYCDDLIVPIKTISGDIKDIVSAPLSMDVTRIIGNFKGMLQGEEIRLGTVSDFKQNTFSVSTAEAVLWGYSQNKFELAKLISLADFCKQISVLLKPTHAYLGTETMHPEDLVDGVPDLHFDSEFFSEDKIVELANWYTGVYLGQ